MSILYLTENLLAGTDVTLASLSEDTLYVLENLYCGRPSKPFRTTGLGAVGSPEYVAVQFDAAKAATFFALFNHNLELGAAGDGLVLKGSGYTNAGANWASPDYSIDLTDRIITGWNDLYKLIGYNSRTYRLEVIDSSNADGFIELGEIFIGDYAELADARIQPGRRESPKYYRAKNVTPYGQDWTESYAESVTLNLDIWNANDPEQIDAVRTMLQAIQDAGGHFVIVPDSGAKWCYYVSLENDGGFMESIARGSAAEVSAWTLELRTLTRGIKLL